MRRDATGRSRFGAGDRFLKAAGTGKPGRDQRGRVTVEYAVMMLAAVVMGLVAWFGKTGGPIPAVEWGWRFARWLSDIIMSLAGGK